MITVLLLAVSSMIIPPLDIGSAEEDKIRWDEANKIGPGRYLSSDIDEGKIYLYGDILAQSLDNGESWNFRYSDGHYEVEEGMIYRIRENGTSIYGKTIQFCKSENIRKEWTESVEVLSLKGNSDGIYGIQKIDSDLFVYSYDEYQGAWSIKVSRSTDDGKTWSEPSTVASRLSMNDPYASGIIRFKNKLYLSYYTETIGGGGNIVVTMSRDNGISWNEKVTVVDKGLNFNPLLKTNGERLFITYLKLGGVYFTKSSDGTDWSTPKRIGDFIDFTDPNHYYTMTVRKQLIFVGYMKYNEMKDSFDLKISYSSDNGNSWDKLNDPMGMNGNAMRPILRINNRTLHFFWVYMGENDLSNQNFEQYHRSAEIGELFEKKSEDSPGFSIIVFLTVVITLSLIIIRRKVDKN